MNGKDPSLAVAERLAIFFLQHPDVLRVHLFGSVAMWGKGDDIDLVLETPDHIARQFLTLLHDGAEQLDKEHRGIGELYGVLKGLRAGYAFQLLGWQGAKAHEAGLICWAGTWTLWNGFMEQWLAGRSLFNSGVLSQLEMESAGRAAVRAEEIEVLYHHPYDLFLFPVGWQDSSWVDELLPRWSSTRPFATIPSFRDVVAWQARAFDPAAKEFTPHRKLLDASLERKFRELKRREYISWSLRHKEIRELWAQDAQANQ